MKTGKEISPIFSYIQALSVCTFLLSLTFLYVTLNSVLRWAHVFYTIHMHF